MLNLTVFAALTYAIPIVDVSKEVGFTKTDAPAAALVTVTVSILLEELVKLLLSVTDTEDCIKLLNIEPFDPSLQLPIRMYNWHCIK
jgi:hypothetical protein